MNRVFIFDVDGTLTPSRQRMTEEFAKFFDKWSNENKYYLVTGSDLDKTKEQLPIAYIDRTESIFTCCGNQQWINNELIYDNKFKVTKKLNKLLGTILSNSIYPHRYGNHIEDRGSMVNFSIVGRNCTQEQREDFYKWDNEKGERKIIASAIKEKFPNLDAVLGGQISIDIYPKGNDKSQVLEHIEKLHPKGEIIFIGDGIENGGNDYPLAKLMEENEKQFGKDEYKWYHTEGWKHTKEILESLDD